MSPSIKYQFLLLTSIIFLLTNIFWTTIARYFGLTETDDFWRSILILIPDVGPFIWFVIMAIVGIRISQESERLNSSWSRCHLEDRKALFASVCISNLILSWGLTTFGFSCQRSVLNPGPQYQWNPRSPRLSLFYFLCRCAMVLFYGVVFYGLALLVGAVGVAKWEEARQVEQSVKSSTSEKKMEDMSCMDTT